MKTKIILGLMMGFVCSPLFAAELLFYKDMAAKYNLEPVKIPAKVDLERTPTLNKTGYVFHIISPVARQFLDDEIKPKHHVMEIGTGFSEVPIEAIKRGCGAYIANDVSLEHLKIL